MTFDELINSLMSRGIEVTLTIKNGTIWYDLNTGMKSHLRIAKHDDETFKYEARYTEGTEELSWKCLVYLAQHCLCGREYMRSAWQLLLEEEGLIEIETRTKVIIK